MRIFIETVIYLSQAKHLLLNTKFILNSKTHIFPPSNISEIQIHLIVLWLTYISWIHLSKIANVSVAWEKIPRWQWTLWRRLHHHVLNTEAATMWENVSTDNSELKVIQNSWILNVFKYLNTLFAYFLL